MIQELTEQISNARTNSHSAEQAAETAIMVHLAAKAEMERLKLVQKDAADLIGELMVELGTDSLPTRVGKAAVTKPGQTITYDRKALDALVMSSDEARRMLEPHRTVKERAGSLRITAAK